MTRTDKRVDVRAYQILKAAEGRGALMVGKPVAKKKIDYCTAYEIVARTSFLKPGNVVYAYRIVEAEIVDGKIMGASTAQGGDELTFDGCVDLIGKYKKFHAAPVKSKNEKEDFRGETTEKWCGVIELHFEADSKVDANELYDALWMIAQKTHRDEHWNVIVPMNSQIKLPEGIKFTGAELPEDAVFLPEN